MNIVVIKVGGSLFDLPDLRTRLEDIFQQRKDDAILLIAGGGAAVDLVRKWDRDHQLGEERSHWLALESMGINELLLETMLETSQIVSTRQAAEKVWQTGGISILNCYRFLKSAEATAKTPLPHTWESTSDSIAAWIAIEWPANELLLLKSVDAPTTREESNNALDTNFATLFPKLPKLSWCNLRECTEIKRI